MPESYKARLWLCLLCAVSLWLAGCASDPDAAESAESIYDHAVIKSPNDDRNYRYITLDNQLDVLLISDPTADKGAAAMDVYIGSYQNPGDREGLAHFLEHMLFLGTRKYPEAGEYQTFISEHGGTYNAGTSFEHTSFYFDIDAQYLEQTLDRFSQFFVAPNFDVNYVNRERNAVESEYRLKVRDDGRRQWDVIQEQVQASHPMSKFTVGNLRTLADRPNSSVRDELLRFYREYYSANLMKLVVLGRESLDDLDAMVRSRFAAIPDHGQAIDKPPVKFFDTSRLPLQIVMQPLKEIREISLVFQLPPQSRFWQKKPLEFLAVMLGTEAEGSLLQALKDLNWADGLAVSNSLEDRGGALFNIDINLTALGLQHKSEIVDMTFAWIDLVRAKGIDRWRYEERARISDAAFRFHEKPDAIQYVSSLATAMQELPPAEVLRGNYMMEAFDSKLIREMASYLVPDNLVLMIVDPDAPTDRVSRYYQTPYALEAIDEATVARWRHPEHDDQLSLAGRNPFVPGNLNVLAAADNKAPPKLLVNRKDLRVWHHADNRYGVPRAHLILRLKSLRTVGLREQVMADLFLDILRDGLNAKLYPAQEAGLEFSLDADERGMSVVIGGYSDRQSLLLERLLQGLFKPEWDATRFSRLRDSRLRNLHNFQHDYPFRQALAQVGETIAHRWTPLQKAAALENVELQDLREYSVKLLHEFAVELLISGNHSQADARKLVDQVKAYIPLSNVSVVDRIAKLPQTSQEIRIDVEHEDHAGALYLQGRDDTLQERALLLLLNKMLASPFYNRLRTEKQLGYVVAAFPNNYIRVPGMLMLVQSPVIEAGEIEQEINSFIQDYSKVLDKASDVDLARYKLSVLTELEEIPKNLAELNSRYWESLSLGYSGFDFREQLIAAINATSLQDMKSAYRDILLQSPRALWVSAEKYGKVEQQAPVVENEYKYVF